MPAIVLKTNSRFYNSGSWRTYRLAYLSPTSDPGSAHLQHSLFSRLHDCGYVEGKNLVVERRFAEGRHDRLEELAGELVALKPDVLFVGGTQGAIAASRATRSVPVVASDKLGMDLPQVVVKSEQDLGMAFDALAAIRPDALYVMESPLNFMHRARIVESVSDECLPAVYGDSECVEAGGLISYSSSLVEQFRGAANFIDKIFRGAKAAELPVEQVTKFELVINLETAKAIGIAIPRSILQRADRLIE